jgi:uncharacterized protein YbjT (DUF2867 family)
VRKLQHLGWEVRGLTRHRGSVAAVRQLGVSAVEAIDLGAGTAAQRDAARSACARLARGADVVISCIGGSLDMREFRDRRDFRTVDIRANADLFHVCRTEGVRRAVYVGVCDGQETLSDTAYMHAHEQTSAAMRTLFSSHAVVRPTGFFWFFGEFLRMAQRGPVFLIGDGSSRTNPIHEEDVAEACTRAALSDDIHGDFPVGGPDVLSRREIAQLAFRVLGKPERIVPISASLVGGAGRALAPLHPRLGQLVHFGARVSITDVVAPSYGVNRLETYFRESAVHTMHA